MQEAETITANSETASARSAGYLFRLLVGGYGLGASLFLFLRLLVGDDWNLVALYNAFGQLIWFGALLLTVLLVVLLLARGQAKRQRWVLLALNVIPALAFLLTYGGQVFAGERSNAAAAETWPTFTVMSHNLLGSNREFDDVVRQVLDTDADFVAFQEFNVSMAAAIVPQLESRYPHMALDPGTGVIGNGFLSKYPILEHELWRPRGISTMGYQRLLVAVDGVEIVIYNVHPPPPTLHGGGYDATARSGEIAHIVQRQAAEDRTVLLMGDFNMTDLHDDYDVVTETFRDVFAEIGSGFGWTWPDHRFVVLRPLLRLDYIFYRNQRAGNAARFQLAPIAVAVKSAAGSDHRAVWTQFAIEDITLSAP